ncbi:hypothetical protein [Ralstonia insidiosa]|uniref:hypothetical protein n=1 Tax=Ralstonia insidiosa TaxID=190721 RepID=UPI001FC9E8DE|nr:hypothetical protein [Ralstonia insidiosa]
MTTARACTREEALRLLDISGIAVVELDYETGWQDAVELGRMGQKVGIRVEFRGHESVPCVSSTTLEKSCSRTHPQFWG